MNLEDLFFSHGKSNSCGVTIAYYGTEDFKVVNIAYDNNGRMPDLIHNAEMNSKNFLLISFYNSNTEPEELSTFSTLQTLLEKNYCFWRGF